MAAPRASNRSLGGVGVAFLVSSELCAFVHPHAPPGVDAKDGEDAVDESQMLSLADDCTSLKESSSSSMPRLQEDAGEEAVTRWRASERGARMGVTIPGWCWGVILIAGILFLLLLWMTDRLTGYSTVLMRVTYVVVELS